MIKLGLDPDPNSIRTLFSNRLNPDLEPDLAKHLDSDLVITGPKQWLIRCFFVVLTDQRIVLHAGPI
jgi:hypothetical protein